MVYPPRIRSRQTSASFTICPTRQGSAVVTGGDFRVPAMETSGIYRLPTAFSSPHGEAINEDHRTEDRKPRTDPAFSPQPVGSGTKFYYSQAGSREKDRSIGSTSYSGCVRSWRTEV